MRIYRDVENDDPIHLIFPGCFVDDVTAEKREAERLAERKALLKEFHELNPNLVKSPFHR